MNSTMEDTQPPTKINSSVKKIPVEIWTEIFCIYCAQDADSSINPVFSVQLTARGLFTQLQTITRTCGTWRRLVFSNPVFWSSFFVILDHLSKVEESKYLLEALSRSRTTPLRLDIVYDHKNPDFNSNTLDTARFAVVASMLEQANRWQDLRFDLSPRVFARIVEQLSLNDRPLDGYFPNLKRLDCSDQVELLATMANPELGDRSLYGVFDPCPALRHLCVFDIWKESPFDYSHLTSLKLVRFEASSLSTLLSRCPRLQSLSLAKCYQLLPGEPGYEDPSPWSRSSPFHHQSITSLSLPNYSPKYFEGLMWADVRFPNLDTLSLGGDKNVKAGGIQALLNMLLGSGCTLKTLVIEKMSSKVFRRFLSVAPSLKSLTLGFYYLHRGMYLNHIDHFLAPLYGTDPSRLLVPVLSCLTIKILPEGVTLDREEEVQSGSIPPYNYYPPSLEEADRATIAYNMADPSDSDSGSSSHSSFDSEAESDDDENDNIGAESGGNVDEADPGAASASDMENTARKRRQEAFANEFDPNAAYFLVDRLRLMILSRQKGPPSVRIKVNPFISKPMPSSTNPDEVLTHLPEYLLAAVNELSTSSTEESLVTLQLYWE
ncbi:hypothetical protein FB446DRAFT_800041 [Lentinula raphanica]|nr:hypothetical protein FB446DRAFT_800041 [Lentinula raphanica]